MSASLVGSEMCIRDSPLLDQACNLLVSLVSPGELTGPASRARVVELGSCLLYTSDAADDM
eukprot:15255172-Alexandrium_andersonii.AAC.1